MHAAFDAVTPPYAACIFYAKTRTDGQDRTDRTIEKVHGSEWALRATKKSYDGSKIELQGNLFLHIKIFACGGQF